MTDLAEFVAGLPKAELHVHHIGSASPQTMAELAARPEGSTPVPQIRIGLPSSSPSPTSPTSSASILPSLR